MKPSMLILIPKITFEDGKQRDRSRRFGRIPWERTTDQRVFLRNKLHIFLLSCGAEVVDGPLRVAGGIASQSRAYLTNHRCVPAIPAATVCYKW